MFYFIKRERERNKLFLKIEQMLKVVDSFTCMTLFYVNRVKLVDNIQPGFDRNSINIINIAPNYIEYNISNAN